MTIGTSNLTLEARTGYAYCRYSGPFQAARLASIGSTIAAFCAEYRLGRVLIDLRESYGDVTIEDRYRIANYTSYDVPSTLRIAICIRADQADAQRTWSSAMAARGFQALSFVDDESALGWLLLMQPASEPTVLRDRSDA